MFLLSNFETTLDKDYLINRTEETRANSQMRVMCCIVDDIDNFWCILLQMYDGFAGFEGDFRGLQKICLVILKVYVLYNVHVVLQV